MRRWGFRLGLAVAWTFLGLFLVAPVVLAAWSGVDATFLAEVFRHPVYRQGLLNALGIAVVTTLMAFVLALPLAWLSARCRFRGKRLAEVLLLAPLILPPFVGALGMQQVFGRYGVLNALTGAEVDWLGAHRFLAVCLIEALHLYPVLYLSLCAGLARIDESQLEAARGLGAGWVTRLRRIVLPLLRPALFGGGIIVFVWSFTELGTPLLLGYRRTLPVQAFDGLVEIDGNPLPYAQVLVMLAVTALAYLALKPLVLGRSRRLAAGSKGGGGGARPRHLGGGASLLAWAGYLLVAGLGILPHLAVALLAVGDGWYGTVLPAAWTADHLRGALAHPLVVPAIINSLHYAAGATVVALVLGAFIAWVVVRAKPWGSRALDLAATLPLAIPGVILAFGYLAVTARVPGLGWLDPRHGAALILVIAYAVRRLPYVTRAAAAGLAQVPPAAEEAAATLGAGPATRLRRIVAPLCAASLVAGALLTFSFSMLEVGDSLILAQLRADYPITKVIYELVSLLGAGPAIACAFGLWAMTFLALTLIGVALVLGRRLGGFVGRMS